MAQSERVDRHREEEVGGVEVDVGGADRGWRALAERDEDEVAAIDRREVGGVVVGDDGVRHRVAVRVDVDPELRGDLRRGPAAELRDGELQAPTGEVPYADAGQVDLGVVSGDRRGRKGAAHAGQREGVDDARDGCEVAQVEFAHAARAERHARVTDDGRRLAGKDLPADVDPISSVGVDPEVTVDFGGAERGPVVAAGAG